MATFSNRLKFLRKQKSMTQLELADRVGVNKQTISQYERGVRRPDFDTLNLLCDFFNVSTDYILGNVDVTPRYVDSDTIQTMEQNNGYMYIPLYSSVSAGHGCFADGNIEEFIPVPSYLGNKEDFFALRVKGNSMEPQIMDGDILVAMKNLEPKDGETVIAIVNGDEGFCKRLVRYPHMLGLVSNNPEYDPLMFTEQEVIDKPVRILGTVAQLIRKF